MSMMGRDDAITCVADMYDLKWKQAVDRCRLPECLYVWLILGSKVFRFASLQVEYVKKKKTKKVDVPVTAKVWGALSPPDLQKATEEEYEMQLQDKVIEETKEKKNAVEAYVYSMRNKVRPSGHLIAWGLLHDRSVHHVLTRLIAARSAFITWSIGLLLVSMMH